jgi:hypothetical protein
MKKIINTKFTRVSKILHSSEYCLNYAIYDICNNIIIQHPDSNHTSMTAILISTYAKIMIASLLEFNILVIIVIIIPISKYTKINTF